jgi:hypothetical protein
VAVRLPDGSWRYRACSDGGDCASGVLSDTELVGAAQDAVHLDLLEETAAVSSSANTLRWTSVFAP